MKELSFFHFSIEIDVVYGRVLWPCSGIIGQDRQAGSKKETFLKCPKNERNECGPLLPCHRLFARGKCVCSDNRSPSFGRTRDSTGLPIFMPVYLVEVIELKGKLTIIIAKLIIAIV